MIEVNGKLGAIEGAQNDLKDAQAGAIQDIKDEAAKQATVASEAADDLLKSIEHLKAIDEATGMYAHLNPVHI